MDMILYRVLFQCSWENASRARVIPIPASSLDLGHGMVYVSVGLRPKVFDAIRAPAILKGNQVVKFIVSG